MRIAQISQPEERIPFDIPARLRKEGIDVLCKHCKDREELVEFAANADVIWLFGPNIALDAAALPWLPACRALFRSGSGLDALPCAEAEKRGIRIFNTPQSISESVAEHTVALLLSLARNIPEFDRQIRRGEWDSSRRQTKWHLTGRTLGLVGYGHIARSVAKMLSGFTMQVLHHDPAAPDSVPLDELLRRSDFISLHCPLTPETRHLIDSRELDMMKPNALLINTSRGGVIDEAALTEALEQGRIGGAALDVTECEPLRLDNRLLQLPNVIITPHIAAFSADFEKNFFESSFRKLLEIRDIIDIENQHMRK